MHSKLLATTYAVTKVVNNFISYAPKPDNFCLYYCTSNFVSLK